MFQKLDGQPILMGSSPKSETVVEKALSSANFQAIAPKAPTPAPAPSNTPAPTASTNQSTKS